MLNLKRHMWTTAAVFVILTPSSASAQTVTNSFEQLRTVLRKGQTIVVTEGSGRQTKGNVSEVTPSLLTVLTPETRTFAEGAVADIRTTDSLRNGALIGLVIGAGIGLAGIAAMCADGPDCGPSLSFGAITAGIGAAAGAGIDALAGKGGRVLYRSPQGTRRVRISPFRGKDTKGILLSVGF